MNCPSCRSKNWKLCRVVYDEGLVHVETSTSGGTLGAGIGTGGIGVGYARTSADTIGSHQSEFSKAVAPPEIPPHPGE